MKLILELTDEMGGETVTERPFLIVRVNDELVGMLSSVDLTTQEGLPIIRASIVDYSKWLPDLEEAKGTIGKTLALLRSVPWLELEVLDPGDPVVETPPSSDSLPSTP